MIRMYRALSLLLLATALVACSRDRPAEPEPGASTVPSEQESTEREEVEAQPSSRLDWALALHGGAGVIDQDSTDAEAYYAALEQALGHGRNLLIDGAAALEVVEAVVRILEDDERFNAGRGAVFTNKGTHELDAAIMDGRTLACGAVAGVRNVRNPITLARQVMERSPHVLLTGEGADEFSKQVGVRRAPQDYFTTQRRYRQWQEVWRQEQRQGRPTIGMGTVGAVALDQYGNLAAATSTGGLTNKRFGRVGDVPIIGAGTYANNRTAAISCTGKGEQFIRHAVAHDISARIEYKGVDLQTAAEEVIQGKLTAGDGGMVGVAADGTISLVFNSPGMFRGAADSNGRFEVGIWEQLRSASPPVDGATDSGGSE